VASILDTINPFEHRDITFALITKFCQSGTEILTLSYKLDCYGVGVEGCIEASHLRSCYDFDHCGIIERNIKIDSDNVLNPKDLSIEDKTLLKMLNSQVPDFVWTIYYLMKDCLDSKISEEELLDRLYLMVDNKPNF